MVSAPSSTVPTALATPTALSNRPPSSFTLIDPVHEPNGSLWPPETVI